jgi:exodeoxyribonuclease V gamma subunit
MGGQGRDFFDWVNEFESEEVQLFEDPGEKTLLSCIQSDVLYLRDRGGNDARHLVAAGDSSVQIHSCHSPVREMEVLYDSLLDLVERDPHLMPKDILVMAPDVEAYAPYIQAVFGTPEEESARFPFSIADRNAGRESRLVNAFFQILDLCSSRMTASDVMTTVESRPVRERFGFVEADLHLVRRWIRESGIRWGIDGEFRRRCGLPPSEQNTWKMGLDRLLLGYAMSEENERMFHGILPYGAVEGGETAALERLVIFCDRLFGYVKAFEQVRAVNEWANVLTELIDDFLIVPGSDGPESRWLKERIADLKEHGHGPGENEKTVDLSAIRWYLARSLEETGLGRGFLSGGITFCAMLPMRSIPFKVICLVGMNSDAYPRKSNSVGFDLMVRSPRRGDRSRRRDDRYLFLEALLSAREVLYISYVGQSMRDNSVRPPSVLVSELTDYIEKGFRFADGDIRNHVVTTHRLQPFNHAYFQAEGRHFSYSKTHAQVAEAGKNRQKASPFVSRGLRAPEEEGGQVSLTDLCRFFFNPAKFFLNRRLNMALEDEGAVLEDEEAFEVSGLERYKLEQDLVERALSGQVLEGALTATQAAGILPHGVVGECLYKRICRQAEEFVQKTRPYLCGCRSVLHLDLNVSDIQLYGELNHVYGNGPVFWRYALLQPKDRLWAWIHHLATQAVADIPKKVTTVIGLVERGKDKRRRWTGVQFDPVSNASVLLEDLLRIYKSGLGRAVPFFPETSWAYAYRFQRSGSSDAAKRVAGQVWRGSLYHRGEGDDPYCRLCFRDVPPLDIEFEDLAITVFGPLLRNCRFISHEEESR